MVRYDAPKDTPGAVELFTKARANDSTAVDQVREMIREQKWTDWIGDLGQQATRQLIHTAAGGDAVWATGITEKVTALMNELLGDNPTVLEELLVRRVVNGWVAVHALELELTIRPPLDQRSKEHLDRAMTRSQKRYCESIRELARVRRIQAPQLLTQLNVVADRAIVATGPLPTEGASKLLAESRGNGQE